VDRYVIAAYPQTPQLVADGVRWLVREAKATAASGAAILVPEVQSIRNLSAGLGVTLASQNRGVVCDGIEMTILIARQMPSTFAGPVLVVWANTQMAARAEDLDPTALCATSWERDGLKDWVRVWGATDPCTGEHHPPEVPPPAVAGAVASISFHMPGDVLHPSDKARAVDALRALKLCGYDIDPPMIRALAIRRGWLPRAADRLAEIAEKFAAGKAVKGGTKMNITRAREMVSRFGETDI
jgi:hypothetical protein